MTAIDYQQLDLARLFSTQPARVRTAWGHLASMHVQRHERIAERVARAEADGWRFQHVEPNDSAIGLTDFKRRTVTISPRTVQRLRPVVITHELFHVERGMFPPGMRLAEENIVEAMTVRDLIRVEDIAAALAVGCENNANIGAALALTPSVVNIRLKLMTVEEWQQAHCLLAAMD